MYRVILKSSAIVPTTPSERSQIRIELFHHHRSIPRNRRTARAQTPRTFFFFFISLAYSRYENRKTDELRSTRDSLSSAIVPTTPSERSKKNNFHHHHRSTPRNRPKIQRRYKAKKETQTQTRTKKHAFIQILKKLALFFVSRVFFSSSSSFSFFFFC